MEEYEELKTLEMEMNDISNKMGEVGNSCFQVCGNTIKIHHSPEYATLRNSLYEKLEYFDKKKDEYLIRYADVVPCEILGFIRPKINGETKYGRILLRILWKYRVPYEK